MPLFPMVHDRETAFPLLRAFFCVPYSLMGCGFGAWRAMADIMAKIFLLRAFTTANSVLTIGQAEEEQQARDGRGRP